MCSRWYTPGLPLGTTDICLYQGTTACISVKQKSVPSVCSQQVTACFRSGFISNCLPARYFLSGPNIWKLLGATLQTRTCDWLQYNSWEVMACPHYNPDFIYSDFHLSELYKKNVGCKQFVANANMKQVVTSRLQALKTNFICPGAT